MKQSSEMPRQCVRTPRGQVSGHSVRVARVGVGGGEREVERTPFPQEMDGVPAPKASKTEELGFQSFSLLAVQH